MLYNLYLFKMYQYHINVKVYSFVSIIKYIYKYIYKNKNCIITQIHNIINKID